MTMLDSIRRSLAELDRQDLELLCASCLVTISDTHVGDPELCKRVITLSDQVIDRAEQIQLQTN